MFFSDIHMHLLFGTDDGADDCDDMYAMVDAAYSDGTRLICATPHFCPTDFGENSAESKRAFAVLEEYCREKYPDLKLFLGNELFYLPECISWIEDGLCNTLGGTRYVLVEFDVQASARYISMAVTALLNTGYVPIIAHAERYKRVGIAEMAGIRKKGVLIQVNADACLEKQLFVRKTLVYRMLEAGIVDFVSSDAHSMENRPPLMKDTYVYLLEHFGEVYANALCRDNALKLFL